MIYRGTWKVVLADPAVAGSPFTLADYSDVVMWEKLDGGPEIQLELLLRAVRPVQFDRKNRRCNYNFTLTKEWLDQAGDPSNALSAAFFITGWSTYGGVWETVTISHMDYTGVETSWTLSNAGVRVSTPDPLGPTTVTHVAITAGPATLVTG
jgi:hypothetical protein